jgi:hypothetical protein
MKLLIIHSSPTSYYFTPLQSKYPHSAACSQILSVDVLNLMSESKFHIHTKLQAKSRFCKFQFLRFWTANEKTEDSELNGNRHYPKLICSYSSLETNFALLLSLPNI